MLPALAFNNTRPDHYVGHDPIFNAMDETFPKCFDFDSLAGRQDLAFKSSELKVNGLRLNAVANTPICMKRDVHVGNDLWIPLNGCNSIETEGKTFHYDSARSAFLGSTGDRFFRTSIISAVCIHLDPERLNATHAAMVGLQTPIAVPAFARTLPLDVHRISFRTLFKNVFAEIDALDGNPQALERLTTDDTIYRLCVGLLQPEIFANPAPSGSTRSPPRAEILKLCEFLTANLRQPISLTHMEQCSGLSSRVLQYSFRKYFGLRPKEWHRKQRLHGARAALMGADGGMKISALAFDFGFPSASDFSYRYRLEFGESPSQTMLRNS